MLSILCVTRAERYALPFLEHMDALAQLLNAEFVIACDGEDAANTISQSDLLCVYLTVSVQGPSLESVLDEAVAACRGTYILRLDDDEQCSDAMITWLCRGNYEEHDHWCFPRVHFWRNILTVIQSEHLWPDYQTRLSIKAKSGGRNQLHAGSPFGRGVIAPVAIEHYKFLVKSYAERQQIAARYEAFAAGFGIGVMLPYSLPEDAYSPLPLVTYAELL